ncbi:MAG: dTMP kinase [Pseudonocardia sp.]
MSDSTDTTPSRGRLISIEGLNGVGKTYLTRRVLEATAAGAEPPLVVADFSRRRSGGDGDLARRLLRILSTAASDEHFLRGGHPRSETLLLLAIKMHDYETTLPALRAGRTVIEGRSIHSTAIYQSLILHPDDDNAAADSVQAILETAARWRSLPDLTIVLTDDLHAAVHRAETRDDRAFTDDQWVVHLRAATLFERLTDLDPTHVRLLDRRDHDTDSLVELISRWIDAAPARSNPDHARRTTLTQ